MGIYMYHVHFNCNSLLWGSNLLYHGQLDSDVSSQGGNLMALPISYLFISRMYIDDQNIL